MWVNLFFSSIPFGQGSENVKYIVDISTSYFKNGLSYKLEKNDNKYYVLIDGLKDKTLEKKINTEIKRSISPILPRW